MALAARTALILPRAAQAPSRQAGRRGRGAAAFLRAAVALACILPCTSCRRGAAHPGAAPQAAASPQEAALAARDAQEASPGAYGGPTFSTWEKEGKAVDPRFTFPEKTALPDTGEAFFPWTGTVSHHFLTDPLIDSWFLEIRNRRDVRHFFILSPSHFGLSTRDYSVADGRWECAAGSYVYTNRKLSDRLCAALGVDYDNQVFPDEHGVSTLIPYIRRHFPGADVVAVAVQGEPPLNMDYCERLYQALAPFFDEAGKKENFLVVSSDFSHHGTPEQTAFKDGISQTFFDAPTAQNFIAAVCDNRPSMYVLANLLAPSARSYVLYHTDSFAISGMDGDDITSYFFSLFD